ncbi:MAG: hypothetical protein A2078_12470 [Nitrospirae bacterium GWC2_57_9]|nr:MAG: hypothetical protein A2078_12470 [Nitrospirae bacterium GWC2_57_9]
MKKDRISRPLLEQYRSELSRCVKCGSCRTLCPSFRLDREESRSPRGRMALIAAVLDNRLPVSAAFEDRLETCTHCLACEFSCPSGVPVTKLIQAAREQAVQELGSGLIRSVLARVLRNDQSMRLGGWLAPLALHYRSGTVNVSRGKAGLLSGAKSASGQGKRGTIAFFPGCASSYIQPELGRAAVAVLIRTGYEVIVPEGLQCCGRPLLSLGDRHAASAVAEHNSRVLAALEADRIITACPSCALTFECEYPRLLPPGTAMPALVDIHAFLEREIAGLTLRPLARTVTWHDPCHLGRGLGLAAAARNILRALPGLTLIETKNPDRCCGFGGVMRVTHPEISDGIAREKAESILATGAAAVVTGCPSCRMQIAEGLHRAGSDSEVLHTVQLIEEALDSAE